MNIYTNPSELGKVSADALEGYKLLMNSSVVLLYFAAEKKLAEKRALALYSIRKDIGLPDENQLKDDKSAHTQASDFAHQMYQRIQDYRTNSPKFVVDMLDEGLGFLETLCRKHM